MFMTDQTFFITNMPSSRPADYHLGYMDGCVFLDFEDYNSVKVSLVRISFDGYGCCELDANSVPLNENDSITFKDIIKKDVIEQGILLRLVKQAIELNKDLIWKDAIEEYHLI